MIASFDLLSLISWSIGGLLISSLLYTLYLSGSNRKLRAANKSLELSIKEKELHEESGKLTDQVLTDRLRALAAEELKRKHRQ